ncbi:MAG: hypothetical protein ACYCZX_18400 [Rhodospirillaceae bacterium]
MKFSYLIDKVQLASVSVAPFKHIQINDFLNDGDFNEIISAPEINLVRSRSDDELFDTLFAGGYKIIDFPGCITDKQAYMDWHADRKQSSKLAGSSCEGFGVTVRMIEPRSKAIEHLMAFLNSDDWKSALARKFGIELSDMIYDAGIQKYLDGYEISPHPDIRRKALTFMVNVNPNPESESVEHHTHYMTFKSSRRYVQEYWAGNPERDRCWVPWNWCETQKVQRENNSIVIFSPADDTLHAVKANYNHLLYQRTQLYGNFWHRQSQTAGAPSWENFDIKVPVPRQTERALSSRIAGKLRNIAARFTPKRHPDVAEANYYKRDL